MAPRCPHQLGRHPSDVLRVARPDRQMMDHDFLPLLPLASNHSKSAGDGDAPAPAPPRDEHRECSSEQVIRRPSAPISCGIMTLDVTDDEARTLSSLSAA